MKNTDYEEDKKSLDDPYNTNLYKDFQVGSATDCTGLIPALPETDSELDAYKDMYPFLGQAMAKADDSQET